MRILLATAHRGVQGGAEKYLQALMPALAARGHAVGLLYEYPFETGPGSEGRQIDAEARVPSWCANELGRAELLRALGDWAPDVVYSHGLDDPELERALVDRYPVMLYAHTYYGACISGRKCYAQPRLEPCDREFGAGCLALYYPRRCGGLDPRTMWSLFETQNRRKSLLPAYRAVMVASQHMFREYKKHGVPADRLHLVPLPTGESLPDAQAPEPRPIANRILFLGRLMDVKGVDILLRAVALAAGRLERPLTLTIAGDGPDRERLENLARELGLGVDFAGWVNSARRGELLSQADLVAVPSLWPEPFGLVGIEAGCVGVPAVGFAVGGIPDWLIPGQTGELAPADPPSPEGLAEAIARALANPPHHQKLRVGAWNKACEFSFDRHLSRLEGLLGAGIGLQPLLPASV
jgi:glycosyltransferase involved in cell wall biosynthesis